MKLAIDKDIPYISTFTKDLCKKYDWEIFFFKDSDLSNDTVSYTHLTLPTTHDV